MWFGKFVAFPSWSVKYLIAFFFYYFLVSGQLHRLISSGGLWSKNGRKIIDELCVASATFRWRAEASQRGCNWDEEEEDCPQKSFRILRVVDRGHFSLRNKNKVKKWTKTMSTRREWSLCCFASCVFFPFVDLFISRRIRFQRKTRGTMCLCFENRTEDSHVK